MSVLIVDDAFLDLADAVLALYGGVSTLIRTGTAPTPDGDLDYEALLAGTAPAEDARRGGGDVYGIFYTGGTTGAPKGVTLTHDNMMTSAYGCVASGEFMTTGGRLDARRAHVPPRRPCSWTGGLLGGTHVFVTRLLPAGRPLDDGGAPGHRHPARADDDPDAGRLARAAPATSRRSGTSSTAPRRCPRQSSPAPERFSPSRRSCSAYGMSELSPVATTLLTMADHEDPFAAVRPAAPRRIPSARRGRERRRGPAWHGRGDRRARRGDDGRATGTGRQRPQRRSVAAGCIPATAGTWTRTRSSSSSTASRT